MATDNKKKCNSELQMIIMIRNLQIWGIILLITDSKVVDRAKVKQEHTQKYGCRSIAAAVLRTFDYENRFDIIEKFIVKTQNNRHEICTPEFNF